jgi:hypothetical protein
MIKETIERLDHLLKILPPLLNAIPEKEFKTKPGPLKWSRQEIVGHLIDSATNNHQRFVRIQFEENPKITYDQDNCVKFNHYNELDKNHVIKFWTLYNTHLLEIIKLIPEENLKRTGITNSKVSLEWLINDYVVHLEYHMKKVVDFPSAVTKYPSDQDKYSFHASVSAQRLMN